MRTNMRRGIVFQIIYILDDFIEMSDFDFCTAVPFEDTLQSCVCIYSIIMIQIGQIDRITRIMAYLQFILGEKAASGSMVVHQNSRIFPCHFADPCFLPSFATVTKVTLSLKRG